MENNNSFDVIIIGGSYAGLSAAMALGRSLRNVLIIDASDPCTNKLPNHTILLRMMEKLRLPFPVKRKFRF